MSLSSESRTDRYQRSSAGTVKLFDLLYGDGFANFKLARSSLGPKWEPVIFGYDDNLHIPANMPKIRSRYDLIIPKDLTDLTDLSEQEITFYALYNTIQSALSE